MIIDSICLRDGIFKRNIEFGKSVTLIHSDKNSCGKTTLLRFILYGFGYNIPSTRNIKFEQCEILLSLTINNGRKVKLNRCDEKMIILIENKEEHVFVLPEQLHELHELLFDTNNNEILDNLLGVFYMDQEKGWTLLNHGIVIGSIHFDLDSLIRGLSDRDCSDLLRKQKQLQRDGEKYKQMHSVALYQESLNEETRSLATQSYEEEINGELSERLIRQKQLKSELKRIDRVLSSNKQFKKYIESMKLIVQPPEGEAFSITSDNIVGLDDSIEILVAKRKMVSSDYAEVSSQIEKMEKEIQSEDEQLSFYETASMAEIFDRKIVGIPLNEKAIQREINRLKREITAIKKEIEKETRIDNPIVGEISNSIITYGTELKIGTKKTISADYLFTVNLKELSGAIMHKTAFAFRLAYITAVEKKIGIKLPIILDSPSGNEVDEENIELMMSILRRDFADHQIIIASINTYNNFEEVRVIEIHDRLINELSE